MILILFNAVYCNTYTTIPFPPEDGARVPPKRWCLIIKLPAFTFSSCLKLTFHMDRFL